MPVMPVMVEIVGSSGIGKTTVIERFLAESWARRPWVLRSRCHPSERVAFKAFDGVVDDLSRILCGIAEVAALLPDLPVPELVRAFPVLGRVPAIAAWTGAEVEVEDVVARRRVVVALREILARMAARRPVIVWIDDLQWGELDSAVLLRELLRGPGAPPMLVLLTFRGEDREASACLRFLDAARADPSLDLPQERHVIELVGLGLAETQALTADLLLPGAAAVDREWVTQIHVEAAGNPFLLGELSRLRVRRPSLVLPRTEDVVSARLELLPRAARGLLEAVAIAGRPLTRELTLAMLADDPAVTAIMAMLPTLQKACLLRLASAAEGEAIEIYHSRIRESLVAALGETRRRGLHRRLADVLLALAASDPEQILEHLCGAGAEAEAAPHALRAAERAARALAFERAAALYQQALELGCEEQPRWQLRVGQAEALANAGHGLRAGQAYGQAIDELSVGTADPVVLRRLRLRAAEQLLHSGHLGEGMNMLRATLLDVGVKLPASPAAAMRESLLRRLVMLVRGLRYEVREDAAVGEVATRLDAVWAATTSLAMINHGVSDALGVLHLVEALRLGERGRVVRALGFEAAWEAAIGGRMFRPRSRRISDEAIALAEAGGAPYDRGWAHMSAGAAAWFCADWRRAVNHCELAETTYRAHCTGARWEIAVSAVYRWTALAHLGRLRELQQELPEAIRDAEDRGDLFAANNARQGSQCLAWLAADTPSLALHHAQQGAASWPQDHFSSQHYYHLISMIHIDLYLGDPGAAWARLVVAWPRLRSAQFLRIAYISAELWYLRGKVALALLAAGPGKVAPGELRRSLREAIDRVGSGDLSIHAPFAAVLRGGLGVLDGELGKARLALRGAVAGFDRAAMPLHREAARMRLAGIERDAQAQAQAQGWMIEAGVRSPAQLTPVLAPGPA